MVLVLLDHKASGKIGRFHGFRTTRAFRDGFSGVCIQFSALQRQEKPELPQRRQGVRRRAAQSALERWGLLRRWVRQSRQWDRSAMRVL